MDVLKIIVTIIELIVLAIGITMIFDARKIAEKWFSFGEKNVEDPLSVVLSLTEEEKNEERVNISIKEMLEKYVWSKD